MFNRLILVAVAALAALSLAAVAGAGHEGSGVMSYTGCLVPKDGVIIKVKAGNAPASPCTGGSTQVHLSAGDITKITAGAGLTTVPAAGDNGEVTIQLDSAYSLPQSCESFDFPMWGSAGWVCAEHSVDTGLQMSRTLSSGSNSTEYGIAPAYRVKNTPDCSAGQFATGFNDSGTIQCSAPSASLQPFQARQASFLSGAGVPDDGADHTMLSLAVPAGTYLVTGKGVIHQGDDDTPTFSTTGGNFGCDLGNLPAEFARFYGKDNDVDEYGFALTGIVTTTGEALTLRCFADTDHDLVELRNGTLTAIKVG